MKIICSLFFIIIINFSHQQYPGGEVAAPGRPNNETRCGYTFQLPFHFGEKNGQNVYIYSLNQSAESFEKDFNREIVDKVVNGDVLMSFTLDDGTTYKLDSISGKSFPNQHPSNLIKAFYMVRFGVKRSGEIVWLCEGALINRQWVLTAAGCFDDALGKEMIPTFVRVGEFDMEEPTLTDAPDPYGKYVFDYDVTTPPIPHPLHQAGISYYDLALIKLPRKTPFYSRSINPVCLPWDSETNRNLTNAKVVLTSWALSETEAPLSTTLQEMEMVVAGSEECGQQYADFFGLDSVLPEGIGHGNVLCAKPDPPKTYKCSASSAGSPIIYGESRFVLAGIATSSFNCGSEDLPGIFTAVNTPETLQWIKETATFDHK